MLLVSILLVGCSSAEKTLDPKKVSESNVSMAICEARALEGSTLVERVDALKVCLENDDTESGFTASITKWGNDATQLTSNIATSVTDRLFTSCN